MNSNASIICQSHHNQIYKVQHQKGSRSLASKCPQRISGLSAPERDVTKDKRLQVTQQCDLKFAITSKFVDEVQFDVVPLDIFGIVSGSPYLYDRKVIFYREHNQYHLFKEGIEYIVHSHSFKNDKSLGTTQQLKRVVNACRNLALMSIQCKEENNPKHEEEVSFH